MASESPSPVVTHTREARVGDLDARRHGVGAPVHGVEPVGLHVVDEPRRAADARHEREQVVRRVGRVGDFGQRALHGAEDGVVAASGTPAYLLVAFEIRGGCICSSAMALFQ